MSPEHGAAGKGSRSAAGGYDAARKAVTSLDPRELVELVLASGLRDRLDPAEPCGARWARIREASRRGIEPRLAICAAVRDPGCALDRSILERRPHLVVEGAIIAARAIEATSAVIYVRRELAAATRALERALDEARALGFLGPRAFGSPSRIEIEVWRGFALPPRRDLSAFLAAIEGERWGPAPRGRGREPDPELFGAPVAVHGVEALALLPGILAAGPGASGPGVPGGWAGPVAISVSGHVERPGIYEVPPGTPLRDVIDGPAGGVWKGRALKAAFPQGLSGPLLSARDLAVSAAAHWSVARDRSRSCALIVLDETTDARALLSWLARSYELASREHCGACREASAWILKIAERLRSGAGRPGDVERIAAISRALGEGGLCAEARAASSPIESLVEKFRTELEAGRSKAHPGEGAPHG